MSSQGTAPQHRRPLRVLGRALLWPIRRFFDPRFEGVQESLAAHISAEARDIRDHLAAVTADQQMVASGEQKARLEDLRRFVVSSRDANIDAATFVGEALRDLDERLAEVGDALGERLPEVHPVLSEQSEATAGERGTTGAERLNRELGHEGLAAQRGLWFNWPLTLHYAGGDVRVGNVNERIVELPYAFRTLASVDDGARILDVGAAESTLALSLASLGFDVVALDPRGYPLEHQNLSVVEAPLEEWDPELRFDAVTCISTIEHLGTGEYGEARQAAGADERALERIRELTVPGGILVLTTPLGGSGYERERLEELLHDWQIEHFCAAERRSAVEWTLAAKESGHPAVALVTARRP